MNIAKSKEYAYIHMWYEERTKVYRENVMPSDMQVKGARRYSVLKTNSIH